MLFWSTENGSDEKVLSEQPLHDGREQRTGSGVSVSWIGNRRQSLRAVRFDGSSRRGVCGGSGTVMLLSQVQQQMRDGAPGPDRFRGQQYLSGLHYHATADNSS